MKTITKTKKAPPFEISNNALRQIKKAFNDKSLDESYGLRVGVKVASGCASGGTSYILGFDKKNENDAEYQISNIPIFMAKKDALYLAGKSIDYVDEDQKTGFIFKDKEKSN